MRRANNDRCKSIFVAALSVGAVLGAVTALLVVALSVSGCAGVEQQSYTVLGVNCSSVIVTGKIPLIDPMQAWSGCEKGKLDYPLGAVAGNPIENAAGGASGLLQGASQVGAVTGGLVK